MATTVGQLTIEMAANIVRLQQDMEKAKNTVASAMSSIQKAADTAANALGLIGIGLSGVALGSFVKSAIDAADRLDDLSKKTGLSAESLSSLSFAFKMSNVEIDTMQKALKSLSKNTIDNEEAFTALGISVKNTDGTYKQADVIFKEVAKFFAMMPDGVLKTKLSLELFDKAGQDLIPILNSGADGIEEMTKRAEELGLVISTEATKASEEFKDQLDTLHQQMIATTVNGMTPFIKSASAMIESLMKLPKLLEENQTALMLWSAVIVAPAIVAGIPALVAGLSALAGGIVAVGVAFAANPIALAIMALTAAAIPAIQAMNNYVNANKEAEKANAALNQTTAETARLMRLNKDVQDGNNKASDDAALKMAEAAIKAKERAAEEKKLNDELLKQAEAYRKLISGIEEKTALNNAEAMSVDKLTESQKLEIKYKQELEAGTLKLTKAQQDNLFVKLKALKASEDLVAIEKLEKEILDESAKTNYAVYEAIVKKNQSLAEEITKQKESNDTMFLGADALEKLAVEKLRAQATSVEFMAQVTKEINPDVANAYLTQAKALKELADEKDKAIGLKAAKEAQDAWDKASTSITEGLTDALMRGFESGKGFVENITDFIKNKFKSTVAEFIIKPIMSPIGNMFASIMPSASGMASGGGGMFGSILGGASQMGSLFGSGVSGTLGGAGFMDMMGASSSVMANQGMLQGLSMGAGAVMPYVLAATALVSLVKSLDSSGTMHTGGTATASATGARATTGSELNFVVETNQAMQSSIVDMAGGISKTLNGLQRAFGKAEDVVVGLGFADDSSADGAWGALKILASGKTLVDWASGVDRWPGFEFSDGEAGLAEFTAKIATDVKGMISTLGLPEWALSITNNLQDGATLEEVLAALNQVAEIKSQLVEAGNALTLMGGPLAGLAAAGDSAVLAVSELVGGIDQLVLKAQGFMANYYTENEQAGVLAASLTQSLERAGFSQAQIAALQTRADFRTLLESIDINTNQGAEQFAALLTVQQQFADVQSYLEAQGVTLQELAKSAPQVEILTTIQSQAADSAATALEVANASATSLTNIDLGVTTMTTAINTLDNTMSAGLSTIAATTSSAIALADQAIATARATAQAVSRAGGGTVTETAGIQAYASGGSYGGGMALVGEEGPELIDFNSSGQVYNANQTANIIGGEVATEIRALRDEVAMLRYEARATAVSTSKMAKLQDNWDTRGLIVKSLTTAEPVYTKAV
jgi:hypothetical protein